MKGQPLRHLLNSGTTISIKSGDVSVIVTPSSSFTNSDGGAFAMSSITVSDILDTCNGKVFTIKVYDNSNNEPLSIGTLPGAGAADNSVMIWWGNGYFEGENPIVGANEALVSFPNSGDVYWNDDGNSYNNGYAIETAYDGVSGLFDPGAFKFNLPTPIDATQVYKITLETQDDSSALNIGGVSGQGFYAYYID
ncbi:MAG: hypothetical protein F2704_06100 [Actinobacteria bacterium]|uniref:Unannotated protein n=1 Tax=freshwater metagenome TaxID=449393 RepID=A0A6J7TZJ2_9ZZZZ|nr:hypothetical protein [Actinomycetota bacterium]MSW47587.1 hypothetical protein [Actinomycetota bacterium]MSX24954.1 hypothetical protein [Actinomycetota bacterium]MSY46264.1 hypothetical protein [Actinomycetota bacterium]MSY57812.1 hypothetical protein [Actinomycetota bacterium]